MVAERRWSPLLSACKSTSAVHTSPTLADQDPVTEINPYHPPQATDAVESLEAIAIRRIRPSTTGLILMLSVQSFGYAVAGVVALAMLVLGETVDATLLGVSFAVVHFFVMIFMIRSMLNVRRLRGLRNGRLAAGLACIPFVSPAIWIGIPLGVWLALVLFKQDVAAAFESRA
ncbi:hypothetical protein Rcae01_00017 [Novipirellula caenicola]|uniref:Uncharacterized protein n=1 Tax=Novipirellula caenicola TaxID=1536901 RepID=A0ABP9VMF0_9BACT